LSFSLVEIQVGAGELTYFAEGFVTGHGL
jgi:hypothetical protein